MAKKKPKKATKKARRKKRSEPSPLDMEWRAKMMTKKEELRPELRKYMEINDILGPTLRHPLLVYSGVDVNRAAWVNWVIDYIKKEMEKLRQKGDWFGVLSGYETAFLVQGFVAEVEHFDDETFWKALAEVWTLQEQLWANRKLLLMLFQSPRPKRDKLMTKAEHRAFAKLPEDFPVYRGFIGRRGKGLSWTKDEEKAIWFAKRFAMLSKLGKPKLISGMANKSDVLAYFTRHEESEVVIDPDKVKRQKRIEL